MDAATALDTSPVATDAAVALLATVADPVRWRVLRLLASGQACVCEIQEQVPVASNLLSYHLRVLREAGLITSSKRGRWVDYRLAPDAGAALAAALPVGAQAQP
ncbi:helix-turn-helix transcriptional regulator [Kineosporia sp. R_H_3]|uniref:ArsR/SmtB family transcription factor n=1 Tax=Kineosporia sp. R_H_3 TaxID=1961848 RepID=UPI0018E9C493|nr:metalloregulator ArsR/SmtB family transcription factor [Kineosporia sp. R_H_3]